MNPALLVLGSFLAMEAFASASHRLVMHRHGPRWHRSHHGPPTRGFEKNDAYPAVFAAATIAAIALGTRVEALGFLVWIGAGVSVYGAAYLVVHDVCIHGRGIGRPIGHRGYIGYVRRAHRIHHIGGAAPYGFLFPVLNQPTRERGAAIDARSSGRRDASGRPMAAVAATASLRDVGTEAR